MPRPQGHHRRGALRGGRRQAPRALLRRPLPVGWQGRRLQEKAPPSPQEGSVDHHSSVIKGQECIRSDKIARIEVPGGGH